MVYIDIVILFMIQKQLQVAVTFCNSARSEAEKEMEFDIGNTSGESEMGGPGLSKRSKLGSFRYKAKFYKAWLEEYPFILEEVGDVHSFYCSLCKRKIPVELWENTIYSDTSAQLCTNQMLKQLEPSLR